MYKVKELEGYLIDLLSADESVTGVFISGSLATGTFDNYSDVDIRFVIDRVSITEAIAECRNKILNSDRKVLFFEPCWFSNAIIVHFDNFIKADIFFYTPQILIPSPWLKDIKIIKDNKGFLGKIKTESQKLNFEISEDEINKAVDKFLAQSHECYRRIMRSEYLYADELLSSMKLIIINFCDYLFCRPPIGWYKAEKRFSEDQILILKQHILDEADAVNKLRVINDEFLVIEDKLCRVKSISRDIEKDKYALEYMFKY
ncbi:MAG: hypothetical protein A2Y17_07680 [Clostridiales bacterium GWF2_38_85]|nr:MAG: hypothetical protein A2Y17_07680 [Clostridiales bacterium GWF2_38_85]HBL84245.1 hypothetical protein [Clostridiales bacterium]